MSGQKILVLAAHPDDEVVGVSAAIGRAQLRGAEIFVFFLTHGCLARETLWPWQRGSYEKRIAKRADESQKVASQLGITHLGICHRPARHLWRDLENVQKDVCQILARQNFDEIWLPAYEGGNPDHDALNALGLRVQGLNIQEYAEYNFAGGKVQSNRFPFLTGKETIIHLTEKERAVKETALSLYASERGNLFYIRCEQESFRSFDPPSYQRPPHEGRLWYRRFNWVPFPHPRVDRTDPKQVSAAIATFIEKPHLL